MNIQRPFHLRDITLEFPWTFPQFQTRQKSSSEKRKMSVKSACLCSTIAGLFFFLFFQASFVICTIPPALLGRISFKPPLPALKNQVWIADGFCENLLFELLSIRQTFCNCFSIKYSGRAIMSCLRVSLDNLMVKPVLFLYSFIFVKSWDLGRLVGKRVNANPGLEVHQCINLSCIELFFTTYLCFVHFEIAQIQILKDKQ